VVAFANLARILVGTRADAPRGKAAVDAAQAGMTFAQLTYDRVKRVQPGRLRIRCQSRSATASLDRAGTEREVLKVDKSRLPAFDDDLNVFRLRLDPTDGTDGLEAGPNEQRLSLSWLRRTDC
jgi:hypothetical protein